MLAFVNLLVYAAIFLLSVYTIIIYYRKRKGERPTGVAAQLWVVCLTSLYTAIYEAVTILFMFQCDFFVLAYPLARVTGSYVDLQISWTAFIPLLTVTLVPIYRRLKA